MPSRIFLSSSRPLLPQIVDRLLPESGSGPLRMEDKWILAPTRQAGRRLREALTIEWRNRGGTALLGLEVHSPTILFQAHPPDNVAHAFDWMAAWQNVLTECDPETLPALMPQLTEPMDPGVALSFGQRLQRLRDELFDVGLDITSVSTSPALESEQQRWKELATLEAEYRHVLEQWSLADPVDAKREALAEFSLPDNVQTLILAGVPDPSPVLLKHLQELDASVQCDVWIHAESQEEPLFSDWGIPTEAWQTKPLGTGREPDGWIECLADPSAVLTRTQELCENAPEHPDLALGLLDSSLSKPMKAEMEASGCSLYDPSPTSLEQSAVVRLLRALENHRQKNDPESLRALWRQPALLQALQPENPMRLLEEWEKFAAEFFPDSTEAVDRLLQSESLSPDWRRLKSWLEKRSATEWMEMIRDIYKEETLDPTKAEDRYALRQFQKTAEVLKEAANREGKGRGPDTSVLLQALERETVDPLRVEGTFTAEGWLELPYHPGKQLLLVGLQEGLVPPPPPMDPLLPMQLREELGLKSDRDWLARDAYLFHTMITSRAPGDVRVWVMKRARDGSPRMPSRLLFACPDDELLKRTDLLFKEPPLFPAVPPPSAGISFQPDSAPQRDSTRLSVSDINTYLTCPTRFYFQRILGMHTCDDRAMEPDAAAFGTLLHKVLELAVHGGPCSEEEWQERCETGLESVIIKQLGRPDSMSLRVLQHSARKRLLAAGRIQRDLWAEGWMPIETESKFTRMCNGVEIVGKVDRIDRHPEKGLRILDYKTSDSPDKPSATHLGPPREGRETIQVEVDGKLRQWKNLQLPLYRWLTAPSYPEEPLEVAYFNLPSAVSDTQLATWEQEPALIHEAETCLQAVIGLIHEGVWHPTTKTSSPWDPYAPLLLDGSDWVPS